MSILEDLWAQAADCFRSILSGSSAEIRSQAEARLKELSSVPEFSLALVEASGSTTIDGQMRLMACTVLKRYTKSHWTSQSESFEEPECPPQIKALVRPRLLTLLNDPERSIRANGAAVISSIAQWDWPEQWEELTTFLLQCIMPGGSVNGVDGALRVFAELACDLSDTQLPHLVPILLPNALRLITDPPEGLGPSSVARAIGVFTDCIATAVNMEMPKLGQAYFDSWIPVLGSAIGSSTAQYSIRRKAVNAATEIVQSYAKSARSLLDTHIFPAIWAALHGLVAPYTQEIIIGDAESGAHDSDGEADDLQSLIYELFGFLLKMVSKKSLRGVWSQSLDQLAYHVMAYMQVTQAQIESWESDPNQFVADESEEGLSFSVRLSGVDLLQTMAETQSVATIQAIFAAAQAHLQHGAEAHAAGDGNWWKCCEAALLALGHVSDTAQESAAESMNSLLGALYRDQLSGNDSPMLQGRAVWLASRYAKWLDVATLTQYLQAAVSALDGQHPVPVQVLGLRAVHYFLDTLDRNTLQPYLESIIGSLGHFAREASDDLLVLLLEVATMVAKVDAAVTAANETKLSPLALAAWLHCSNDPVVVTSVEDFIAALAQTPCLPMLTQRVVPTAVSILRAPEGSVAPGLKASATALLQTLVSASSPPLPALLLSDALPTLTAALLGTDDHEMMQNGCEALTAFLKKGSEQINGSNVEGIVNVVAKVLAEKEDSAAVFVGELISKLLGKVSLGPVLQPMLQAVLERLQQASMLSLEQSLVAVYSQLITLDLPQTLGFLESSQVSGHSGLEVLMAKWTDNQPNFHGRYDVNITIMGLCRLLLCGHPTLRTMTAKGARVMSVQERETVYTRSKTRGRPEQYETLPLPIKIFQLLSRELLERNQKEDEQEWEDEDSDDDDAADVIESLNAQLLSDLLAKGDSDDEDYEVENDPELQADPVYNMNVKDLIKDSLRGLKAQDPELFSIGMKSLSAAEQQSLVALLETV